jgi:branched-chain amino acid transport system substrate-binding protein
MSIRIKAIGTVSAAALAAFFFTGVASTPSPAAEVDVPVLVPITGFLSLEGISQRNGALLAFKHAPKGVKVTGDVSDTGTSPEVAVNALDKAMSNGKPIAIAASMLGTQMLAMLPLAAQYKVPLITVSGTAKITEMGNPYVFRYFPGDSVVKVAQARYAIQVLGKKRPALLYQTTAYGQSGESVLVPEFKKLGTPLVFEEGIDVKIKDMLPILSKVKDAKPDVLILQLHSGSTALVVKQAAAMGLGLPIVAGSAMHQPSTAALLEPKEMKGVCAETGSSPISAETPAIAKWLAEYRAAFKTEPDAFALGEYDGVMMVLQAVADGAKTPDDVRKFLSSKTYKGLAMTYKSDGKGNMAHSAEIICYDGTSRIPKVVKHYDNVSGVL